MVFIVLFKGQSAISKLIEWQTRGKYSHAAILIDDTLYEAWQGWGVGVRKKEKWYFSAGNSVTSLFQFQHMQKHEQRLQDFLEAQLGKKYDYLAVLRFITRTHVLPNEKNRWFCSELVAAAMDSVGLPLFHNTKPWEVSPDLIKRSLILEKL